MAERIKVRVPLGVIVDSWREGLTGDLTVFGSSVTGTRSELNIYAERLRERGFTRAASSVRHAAQREALVGDVYADDCGPRSRRCEVVKLDGERALVLWCSSGRSVWTSKKNLRRMVLVAERERLVHAE